LDKILGFAVLLTVCASAMLAQAPDAARGKQLFVKDGCYECHGTMGQGGTGPRLAPRPISLPALMAYVRKPSGNMPPYTSKVMTDAELADVRAYLASLPAPPALKSIPQLNQ